MGLQEIIESPRASWIEVRGRNLCRSEAKYYIEQVLKSLEQ